MPIFDFQGPDGQIHSIEGPEGSTPEQALQALQAHLNAAANLAPVTPKPAPEPDLIPTGGPDVGSFNVPLEALQPFYERVGRFLQKVKENPPPSVAFFRDIPQIFKEESEKIAKGEQFDVPRLGAAALAVTPAGAATRVGRMAATAKPTEPLPVTAKELASEKRAAYADVKGNPVPLPAPTVQEALTTELGRIEKDFGTRAPETIGVLRDAIKEVTPTAPISKAPAGTSAEGRAYFETTPGQPAEPLPSNRLEQYRQQLNDIKPDIKGGGADAEAARQARNLIDEVVGKVAPDVAESIVRARALDAARHRMNVVENAVSRMETENATPKTAFRPITREPIGGGKSVAEREGMNAAEIAALRNVHANGPIRGVLDVASTLAPTREGGMLPNALTAMMHAGPAFATSGASIIPLLGAGYAARGIRGAMTDRAIQRAVDTIAARSPLSRERAARYALERSRYLAGRQVPSGGGLFSRLLVAPALPQLLPPARQ